MKNIRLKKFKTSVFGIMFGISLGFGYEEFYDLPICFIDDWCEINETFLESEKLRINNNSYCLDKLKISYWVDRINKSILNIL